MRKSIVAAMLAAGTFGASAAFAVGPAINAANHTQFNENAYYNGFGGPLPAGIIEGSAGFSTIGNYSGRVLSNAAITNNPIDTTVLTTINTGLFGGTDVNLYKIKITDPTTFSASVVSTSLVLSLFDANGTGVASSVGTTLSQANGVNTSSGLYYLAVANPQQVAQNNAAQAIFTGQVALTAPAVGVYLPNASNGGGIALSTTPATAFSLLSANAASNTLLTNTSFTAAGSTITLSGADFAAVPEPVSLIAAAGVTLIGAARRRRSI